MGQRELLKGNRKIQKMNFKLKRIKFCGIWQNNLQKEKFITLNAYIKKKKRSQINDLIPLQENKKQRGKNPRQPEERK